MDKIFPEKLKKGDEIRIIAPARTLAIIGKESREIAAKRFEDLGLKLSFGKRVEDLHAAFSDKNVKGILTVIGGFNSNQLLRYINWDLVAKNPKIFCGFSDI